MTSYIQTILVDHYRCVLHGLLPVFSFSNALAWIKFTECTYNTVHIPNCMYQNQVYVWLWSVGGQVKHCTYSSHLFMWNLSFSKSICTQSLFFSFFFWISHIWYINTLNLAPTLSGQNHNFLSFFCPSVSLGFKRKHSKYRNLSWIPRNHACKNILLH